MHFSRIPLWARFLLPVAAAHLGLVLLAPSILPDSPAAISGRRGEFTIHFSVEKPAAQNPAPEPPSSEPAKESAVQTPPTPVKASKSVAAALHTARRPHPGPAPKRHAAVKPETPSKPAYAAPAAADDASSFVAPSADADYLDNPRPRYPKASLRRRETGTVILSLIVTPDGEARNVRIVRSSGHPLLDKAARDAVCAWRFVPAKRMGRPVEAACEVPVHFKLKQ